MQWRKVKSNSCDAMQKMALVEQAKTRLRALPIFKSPSDPTLEYFKFGHDSVQSLVRGSDSRPDVSHLTSQVDTWSFLFGGSGDARHVFGTMIDIGDHVRSIYKEDPDGLFGAWELTNTHLTLVDIHPASLARTAVMFSIMYDIMGTSVVRDRTRRAELYATLVYLFAGMIMPDYCRAIIMETATKLVAKLGTVQTPLQICPQSLPAIVDVLKYWSSPLPKTTTDFLKRNGGQPMNSCVGSLNAQGIAPQNQKSPGYSSLTRRFRAEPMPMPTDFLYPYYDAHAEGNIYDRTKALLPPCSLLSRHPALSHLVRAYDKTTNDIWKAAVDEVERTWVPNPTIFDKNSSEHPAFWGEGRVGAIPGYPLVSYNPYQKLLWFEKFLHPLTRASESASMITGFGVLSRFFELVVDSMHTLRKTLVVELVVTDFVTGVPKLLAGELGERPARFPREYGRAWLSNVPDYTNGIINTAVHLAPHLKFGSMASMNVLLNLGNFKTINDFCYNYSLLPAQDFPRYLGCRILDTEKAAGNDIYMEILSLPRALDQLASKTELHTWLSQLLLCTLCNGKPKPVVGWRIDLPNNLGAFVHILVRLREVGFPPHWIDDFFQTVVADNLVTDVSPYLGFYPIPFAEFRRKCQAVRKVNLLAWQAEIQAIVSSVRPALPFSLDLPQDYSSYNEIGTYQTAVRHDPHIINQTERCMRSHRRSSNLLGLSFIGRRRLSLNKLVKTIPLLLDGDPTMTNASVQIMIDQEKVDLRSGEVSWKMGRSWYQKMTTEEWLLVLYRTDMSMIVTDPVKAERWSEVPSMHSG